VSHVTSIGCLFTSQHPDPVLRVEMASTGEVACFSRNPLEALMKGLLSSGFRIPKKAILLSIGPLQAKVDFIPAAEILVKMGYELYATQGTCEFYKSHNIPTRLVNKPFETCKSIHKEVTADCIESLKKNDIDLVINVPNSQDVNDLTQGYTIRRTAVDFNISLLTNIKGAMLFVDALEMIKEPGFKYEIRSWQDYLSEATLL
jgi:carbamoyl-phosphate synthase large subunit